MAAKMQNKLELNPPTLFSSTKKHYLSSFTQILQRRSQTALQSDKFFNQAFFSFSSPSTTSNLHLHLHSRSIARRPYTTTHWCTIWTCRGPCCHIQRRRWPLRWLTYATLWPCSTRLAIGISPSTLLCKKLWSFRWTILINSILYRLRRFEKKWASMRGSVCLRESRWWSRIRRSARAFWSLMPPLRLTLSRCSQLQRRPFSSRQQT